MALVAVAEVEPSSGNSVSSHAAVLEGRPNTQNPKTKKPVDPRRVPVIYLYLQNARDTRC
jgi:hypothetical protein